MSAPEAFKIVVVGPTSVGKSTVNNALLEKKSLLFWSDPNNSRKK